MEPPESGTFEKALRDALTTDFPARSPEKGDPHELHQALREVAVALPMVDNLGITGDSRDLYPWIDKLAGGARALYPEIPCKAGCSACCHYPVSLYTIAENEWQPIARYVEREWPRERLIAFVRRFWETHGPYIWRLKVLNFVIEIPLPVAPRREAIPLACPFLEEDRCAVYDVRPAQARTFGLFEFKHFFLAKPVLYGCEMAQEQMKPVLALGDRPKLPSFNPLFGVRCFLVRGPKRLIPLWVARQWPRKWLAAAEASPIQP
jgi:Fe-S-cluster containining protein